MYNWWTSDPHYNHANIVAYCGRPPLKPGDYDPVARKWASPEIAFQRAEQNNAMLIRNANSRVKPGDTVKCVGDFSCRGGEKGVMGLHIPPAQILAGLNGKWIIIGGNHDDNNGVKTDCEFMTVEISHYRIGVQHRPLYDYQAYENWMKKTWQEREANPWRDRMHPKEREFQKLHTEYCQKAFDFIICGHVHEKWHVKKIAGVWHVNVGVDVNRYMPINDVEVVQLYEKAVRG